MTGLAPGCLDQVYVFGTTPNQPQYLVQGYVRGSSHIRKPFLQRSGYRVVY